MSRASPENIHGVIAWLGGLSLAATVLMAPFGWAIGREPPFRIGQTSVVSADEPGIPRYDSWLAANSKQPGNLIAVSETLVEGAAGWQSAVYYTVDAGSHWHRASRSPGGEKLFWGTDMTVAFGPTGTAFFAAVGRGPGASHSVMSPPAEGVGTYFYRSIDGGKTWDEPLILAGVHVPAVATDMSGGRYHGRVYVASTVELPSLQGVARRKITLAISDDDGRRFDERIFSWPEAEDDSRARYKGPSPIDIEVTPDGVVVLLYLLALPPQPDGIDPDQRNRQQLWLVSSTNGGRTFTEPRLVVTYTLPDRTARGAEGIPRLAVDHSSGTRRGNLYLVYQDFQQARTRVLVTRSTDGGFTWMPGVQVSPDASEGAQAIPALAIDTNGTIGVAWHDSRAEATAACYHEYFSASGDGGLTFLPPRRVSEVPTCPGEAKNHVLTGAQLAVDYRQGAYTFLSQVAHYNAGTGQGLVGLDGGRFHLSWITSQDGVMALASTPIEVLRPPLGRDVSDLLQVSVTEPVVDMAKHTLSVTVSARNASRLPISADLSLLLTGTGVRKALSAPEKGELRTWPINADSDFGSGATWNLIPEQGSSHALAPGDRVRPVRLEFGYQATQGLIGPEGFWVKFHVLEKVDAVER